MQTSPAALALQELVAPPKHRPSQIARMVGVSRQTVAEWLRFVSRPRSEHRVALYEALGRDPRFEPSQWDAVADTQAA